MPNSVSLPFSTLLSAPSDTNPSYKTLLPREELLHKFETALGSPAAVQRAINGELPITTSCGSGMTAAILWLALQVIGAKTNVGLYDEVRSFYFAVII